MEPSLPRGYQSHHWLVSHLCPGSGSGEGLCFLCCQQALLQAWGDLVWVWGSKSHSDLPISRVEVIIRQSKNPSFTLPFIHPSIIHSFTLPFIHPSIIHLSIHLFTFPFIHPSIIHSPIHHPSIHPSTPLPLCPSIYSFIHLSICSLTHFSSHCLSVHPRNHDIHPSNRPYIVHFTHWSVPPTPPSSYPLIFLHDLLLLTKTLVDIPWWIMEMQHHQDRLTLVEFAKTHSSAGHH